MFSGVMLLFPFLFSRFEFSCKPLQHSPFRLELELVWRTATVCCIMSNWFRASDKDASQEAAPTSDLLWCTQAYRLADELPPGGGRSGLVRRIHALLHVGKVSAENGQDRAMSVSRSVLVAFERARRHDLPVIQVYPEFEPQVVTDLHDWRSFCDTLKGYWCEKAPDADWNWNLPGGNLLLAYQFKWALWLQEGIVDRVALRDDKISTV